MEEYANHVHYVATMIMNVSAVLNVLNVLYDVIVLARPEWISAEWVGVLQTIVNICGSIGFGLATTIAALYGSKTLGYSLDSNQSNEPLDGTASSNPNSGSLRLDPEMCCNNTCCICCEYPDPNSSFIGQLIHRFRHTNLKEEALRVISEMERVILTRESPLYETVHNFRESIRSHMLSRMGLSGLLNLLTILYLYFNTLIFVILYSGKVELRPSSARLLYLMLNVVNPIVCLMISYIVVLCDNFNSIAIYAKRVSELVQHQNIEVIVMEIASFTDRVIRPLLGIQSVR